MDSTNTIKTTYSARFPGHDIFVVGQRYNAPEGLVAFVTVEINEKTKYTAEELLAHFKEHLSWCEDSRKYDNFLDTVAMNEGKGYVSLTWTMPTPNACWVSGQVAYYMALYYVKRMILGTL